MAGSTPSTAQTVQPSVFNQSSNAYSGALAGTQAAMARSTYAPVNVNPTMAGYAPQVAAGSVAATNMAPYQNPYTQGVINTTMADMNRSRQMAMNDLDDQFQTAGAFGGSRHGVAMAETNRNFFDQAGRMAAGLQQQGFQNAQNMAQFDIGNSMAAQQFNAGNMQQTNLANAAAANTAALANQNAGMQQTSNMLAAANQLGGLSRQGFDMGRTLNADMAGVGAQQQALQQMLIDAANAQFQQWATAPQQALQLPLTAVGAANMGQQTQTTTQQPGMFNILGTLFGAMAGMPGPCWVAREVYGEEDDRWQQFRAWLFARAPDWFFDLYVAHGEAFAGVVRRVPILKRALRPLMDRARRSIGYEA